MSLVARQEFLLRMYDQMFNDINRHIVVVWQSVGVVVGAVATIALIETSIIPLDIGSTIVVILIAWMFAHLMDAAYWYNRNLAIITNIEREFLEKEDLKNIHYYFGKHRPKNKMITHLRIQGFLGAILGTLVLIYHFYERVLQGFDAPWSNFEPMRSLPFVFVVAVTGYVVYLHRKGKKKYAEFLSNSPGKDVDICGITYGVGHAHNSEG